MIQISLIAAFVAGMVALFAPCCISYLFPAYIGNIFKEKEKVLFMTFIYSLGIFVVMMPIVLGAKILTNFFMDFHDKTYLIGGFIMIIASFLTLIGFKFPMINLKVGNSKKNNNGKKSLDIPSTFMLGVVSGITSSCCAPVLIGVITLSSFSPSILLSLLIGFSYVLGMVFPLYLASLFINKKNILSNPILRKSLIKFTFLDKQRNITVSTLVGSAVFFLSGILMIIITLSGKVSMPSGDESITKSINQVAMNVTNLTSKVPFVNVLFIIFIIIFVVYIFKQVKNESTNKKIKMDSKSCCDNH